MQDKIIFSLSLARKAGMLVMGFDAVKESVYKNKAHLIVYTSDMSPKNIQRIERFCDGLVQTAQLPLEKNDLLCISKKPTGVFSIIDFNNAKLCSKVINEYNLSELSAVIKEDINDN